VIWLVVKVALAAWVLWLLFPFALAGLRIAMKLPRLLGEYLRGEDHAPRMVVDPDAEVLSERWKENTEHDIRMSRVHFD
jgi:hypothetical protein